MTKFRITLEVTRDVPATKGEANEAGRRIAKWLRNYMYSVEVIHAELVTEKS
jgi:hypothetical protein